MGGHYAGGGNWSRQQNKPKTPPKLKIAKKLSKGELAKKRAIAATGVFDREPVPISKNILSRIRQELVKIVTPDCLDKLKQIFDEAANLTSGTRDEDNAVLSNPVELFDATLDQGGFYFGENFKGSSFSTGAGAVGLDTATVVISANLAYEPYSKVEIRALANAALSELIHAAGSKQSYYIGGTFSDVNLAKASYSLGIGLKRFETPQSGLPKNMLLTEYPGDANIDPYNDTFSSWSMYNHKSIRQYCR